MSKLKPMPVYNKPVKETKNFGEVEVCLESGDFNSIVVQLKELLSNVPEGYQHKFDVYKNYDGMDLSLEWWESVDEDEYQRAVDKAEEDYIKKCNEVTEYNTRVVEAEIADKEAEYQHKLLELNYKLKVVKGEAI